MQKISKLSFQWFLFYYNLNIIPDFSCPPCTIPQPLSSCDNYNCKRHNDDLDKFLGYIIGSCIQSEDTCIPMTSAEHTRSIPSWSDRISGLRKQALHYHMLWKQAGSPDEGINAKKNICISWCEHHKAIKSCCHD